MAAEVKPPWVDHIHWTTAEVAAVAAAEHPPQVEVAEVAPPQERRTEAQWAPHRQASEQRQPSERRVAKEPRVAHPRQLPELSAP